MQYSIYIKNKVVSILFAIFKIDSGVVELSKNDRNETLCQQ